MDFNPTNNQILINANDGGRHVSANGGRAGPRRNKPAPPSSIRHRGPNRPWPYWITDRRRTKTQQHSAVPSPGQPPSTTGSAGRRRRRLQSAGRFPRTPTSSMPANYRRGRSRAPIATGACPSASRFYADGGNRPARGRRHERPFHGTRRSGSCRRNKTGRRSTNDLAGSCNRTDRRRPGTWTVIKPRTCTPQLTRPSRLNRGGKGITRDSTGVEGFYDTNLRVRGNSPVPPRSALGRVTDDGAAPACRATTAKRWQKNPRPTGPCRTGRARSKT